MSKYQQPWIVYYHCFLNSHQIRSARLTESKKSNIWCVIKYWVFPSLRWHHINNQVLILIAHRLHMRFRSNQFDSSVYYSKVCWIESLACIRNVKKMLPTDGMENDIDQQLNIIIINQRLRSGTSTIWSRRASFGLAASSMTFLFILFRFDIVSSK